MLSENPRASVIIPSLGRSERLMDCVQSVLSQNAPFEVEVIVEIDGPDSKRVASLLTEKHPGARIRSECSESRRGSPGAKNAGAALASGSILIFVDDDTVAHSGWLEALVGAYGEGVGGVGGSELKQGGTGVLRRFWFRLSGDVTGRVTKGGMVISNFTPAKNGAESVDCLAGANMSFSKEAFVEAGGFDVNFRGTAYREETDLCLRIKKTRRLVFVPSAVVDHLEEGRGGNSPGSLREWNYWYHRNNTYFFLKDIDDGSALRRLKHAVAELAIAAGRTLNQRSLAPLSTMRKGMRDGKSAFAESRAGGS